MRKRHIVLKEVPDRKSIAWDHAVLLYLKRVLKRSYNN